MAKITEFLLTREINKSKSDGKEYSNYYVHGTVIGRSVKAKFIPKDNQGYLTLDIVFEVSQGKPVNLIRKVTSNTNANGQITQSVAYTAFAINEKGKTYEATVKPNRPSDENIMKMLISEMPDDDETEVVDDEATYNDSGLEVHDDSK